jgi:hypothetical protein
MAEIVIRIVHEVSPGLELLFRALAAAAVPRAGGGSAAGPAGTTEGGGHVAAGQTTNTNGPAASAVGERQVGPERAVGVPKAQGAAAGGSSPPAAAPAAAAGLLRQNAPAAAVPAGLGAPSDAEGGDDAERQPMARSNAPANVDPGPASAAVAGALPEAPDAPPAGAAALWEDWRTPEREVVLRQMWPQAGSSMKAIFQALAAIKGPRMPADAENARHWGKRLNLGPRPVMSPQAASAPAAEAAPEPEGVRETPQMVRARELLAMGLHPNDIKSAVRLSAVEFAAIQRAHAEAA